MIPLAVRLSLALLLGAVSVTGVLAAGFWFGTRPAVLALAAPLLPRGRHARTPR